MNSVWPSTRRTQGCGGAAGGEGEGAPGSFWGGGSDPIGSNSFVVGASKSFLPRSPDLTLRSCVSPTYSLPLNAHGEERMWRRRRRKEEEGGRGGDGGLAKEGVVSVVSVIRNMMEGLLSLEYDFNEEAGNRKGTVERACDAE